MRIQIRKGMEALLGYCGLRIFSYVWVYIFANTNINLHTNINIRIFLCLDAYFYANTLFIIKLTKIGKRSSLNNQDRSIEELKK